MKNHLILPFILLSAFFSAAGPLCAQQKNSALWQDVSEAQAAASTGTAQRGAARREIIPLKYRSLALQKKAMQQLLNRAPRESAGTLSKDGVEISLPLPDGGFGRFRIMESPVMEDGLAAKYPEIKTYGLPWAYPGWIGGRERSGSPFTHPELTSAHTKHTTPQQPTPPY
jgi:hypothetical protein